MRLTIVAALSGAAAVALALSGLPADAAPKKRAPAATQGNVDISSQERVRRVPVRQPRVRVQQPRTRITVRPRSYLDGGTEVMPGDRKFTDYAIGPGFTGSSSILGNTGSYHRSPLPGPFDLAGKNNPFQW